MDVTHLLLVLDNLPVSVVIFNGKGRIMHANKSFLNKISASTKDLAGEEFISFLNDSSKREYGEFIDHASKNDLIQIHENINFKILTRDGNELEITVKILDDTSGENTILMGILPEANQDLNLGKELQKQLSLKDELKEELDKESELSDMKSRFLSIASHEFRTPLAGILSSINLITRYIKAEQENWKKIKNQQKISKHLDRIRESVRSLTNILNNFLALGNIEEGEIPTNYSSFNLKNLMAKQTSQLQNICKAGQVIEYEHTSHKEKAYLDKPMLKNIVNNLVSNSIKFSPENTVITVKSEITGNNIHLTFADKGIGIPETEKNKIFRRFYRARNALAIGEGTGLGLNIVRKYTEQLNGKIDFVSKENEGTVFSVTLPNNIP